MLDIWIVLDGVIAVIAVIAVIVIVAMVKYCDRQPLERFDGPLVIEETAELEQY